MSALPRPLTDAERAVVTRYYEMRRAIAKQRRDVARKDALISHSLMFVGLVVGAAATQSPPLLVALAVAALVILAAGILGMRRAQANLEERLAEIARDEERQLRHATDETIDVKRILTATDENGDGVVWFLLQLVDGSWLAIAEEDWSSYAITDAQWRARIRFARSVEGMNLGIEFSGDPIAVERRELLPPDFLETPTTLLWSPPDDAPAGPTYRFMQDPTLTRRGDD